jgi:hypothetical protein
MESKNIEMIAYEGFIRRACRLNMPFMLKGSYITRQYFDNPEDRIPNDLDWVYIDKIGATEIAERTFTEWTTRITEMDLDDGVKFRSFKDNEFWRMIDYAMSEDFPTVNTDLICWVDGEKCDLWIDISFNLEIPYSPVSLNYKPLRGKSFEIKNTVPLALQVSWKLHQTLVRPRFKDLFDLIHLLKHPDFTNEVLQDSLKALVDECKSDNVDVHDLNLALTDNLEKLFSPVRINAQWALWRRGENYGGNIYYEYGEHITDISKLPKDYKTFEKQFAEALRNAGITIDLIEKLPETKQKRIFGKIISRQENKNIFTKDEEVPEKTNEGILEFFANLFK